MNPQADEGYGYFVNRTAHIAVQQGRRPIQWNEVWDHFGTQLPKEASFATFLIDAADLNA